MFNDEGTHNSVYKLSIFLRPRGKCDISYLSGFADCLCAALKTSHGAIDRKFAKGTNDILECHLQVNSDTGAEEETAQFIIDTVEKSSMQLEDVELVIDGRRLTIIDEK